MQTCQVEVSVSRQQDGLWKTNVPALSGWFVDAETMEEAIRDIQGTVRLFIAPYHKHGYLVPLP